MRQDSAVKLAKAYATTFDVTIDRDEDGVWVVECPTILLKPDHMATLSVPDRKEVAKGRLCNLIRAAGLAVEVIPV